jgi:hypothetical protein
MTKRIERPTEKKIIKYTVDCPFQKEPLDTNEWEKNDKGMVCDMLWDGNARARCNTTYPPRYCPLKKKNVLICLS